MNKKVSESFTKTFTSKPFEKQVAICERSELAPLFLGLFKDHHPVLEAGCGSGRWNGWFQKNGIPSDGADWSHELCNRARKKLPACRFFACDLKSIPVGPETYGGIISLGSIEHSKEGPLDVLREFHRILKNEVIAVITIPYGSAVRRNRRQFIDRPLYRFKSLKLLRKLFNKSNIGPSLSDAREGVNNSWWPIFRHAGQGWHFFEYEFNKKQMRTFLAETGFSIRSEFVFSRDSGIYHSFRPLFARYDSEEELFTFSMIGKILRKVMPVDWIGHMLCYVVVKR